MMRKQKNMLIKMTNLMFSCSNGREIKPKVLSLIQNLSKIAKLKKYQIENSIVF